MINVSIESLKYDIADIIRLETEYSRLSVMERKIQYLESKVEMKATHNVDLTVGGDRVVIGAPINIQEDKAKSNIDDTERITYNDGDDSPTRDDVSYTEDISESLAC